MEYFKKNRGFTLIEVIVVIAIIMVLATVVLFGTTQYVSKSKDSNVAGNLAVLVPAGEIFYNMDDTYEGFCNSNVVVNAKSQSPVNPDGSCYDQTNNPSGICCYVDVDGGAWAACARHFANTDTAICVDSRGVKKEISSANCTSVIAICN